MKKREPKWFLWSVLILCFAAAFADEKTGYLMEEGSAILLFIALVILYDRPISYLLLLLSIGKFIDGFRYPDDSGPNELLWIILSVIFAFIYYYKNKKKKDHESSSYNNVHNANISMRKK